MIGRAGFKAITAVNFEGAGYQRLVILHHTGLGRGAAHVERNEVRNIKDAGKIACHQRTGGRAAFDHPYRHGRRAFGPDDATVRQHDQRLLLEAAGLQLFDQGGQVWPGNRDSVGVDRNGRGAEVFAHLRSDHRRERDIDVGRFFRKNLAHRLFVGAVAVGVQKADGDRHDALFATLANDLQHFLSGDLFSD